MIAAAPSRWLSPPQVAAQLGVDAEILSGFLFGIGFHVGWGIVSLIVSMPAAAVEHDAGFLH